MFKKITSLFLIFIIFSSSFSNVFASASTDIPDLIILFQNPSYINDKDLIQDEYHCDSSKTECKVNFDLRYTF
jgi:hypothetical protein